jgi:hypothetical protein
VNRALAFVVAVALSAAAASSARASTVLDRAVARFSDPEATDAAAALRFVMMRELVVESWLVAGERAPGAGVPTPDDKAIRIALERHVIEAVLGARPLPAAAEARVPKAVAAARLSLAVSVGGEARLEELLARAAGDARDASVELAAIVQRRARAELYLEVAVVPPAEPSELELRTAWSKAPAPLPSQPFETALPAVRAWLRSARLRETAQAYHQAVRAKLRLELVPET